MSIQELNAITLEVIENQRRATHAWVAALQTGGKLAYGKMDDVWKDRLVGKLPLLSEGVREKLIGGETKLSGKALDSLNKFTSKLESGFDSTIDRASKLVGQIDERAGRVDGKVAGKALNVLSRASMPAAKLSRKVSGSVADGVEKLAARVGGEAAALELEAPVAKVAKVAKKAAAAPSRLAKSRR